MKFPKQKLRKKLLTSLRGSLRVSRAIKVNKKILDFPDEHYCESCNSTTYESIHLSKVRNSLDIVKLPNVQIGEGIYCFTVCHFNRLQVMDKLNFLVKYLLAGVISAE